MEKIIVVALGLLLSLQADAYVFSMQFFDLSGNPVGTGTYAFDTTATDTDVAFDDLSNLSWSFDLPTYSISIGSATGDSTSRESTAQEGVRVTSVGPTVSLVFFDSLGSYISHNDESSLPARTSVRFLELSNTVEFIRDDITLATGSYTATAVPEPSGAVMVCLAGAFWFRRQR